MQYGGWSVAIPRSECSIQHGRMWLFEIILQRCYNCSRQRLTNLSPPQRHMERNTGKGRVSLLLENKVEKDFPGNAAEGKDWCLQVKGQFWSFLPIFHNFMLVIKLIRAKSAWGRGENPDKFKEEKSSFSKPFRRIIDYPYFWHILF